MSNRRPKASVAAFSNTGKKMGGLTTDTKTEVSVRSSIELVDANCVEYNVPNDDQENERLGMRPEIMSLFLR